MFNSFKKQNQENKSNGPIEFEKAPRVEKQGDDLALEPEYQEIRTMPGKFSSDTPKSKGKKQFLTLGIIVFLIILILIFTGLLIFTDIFDKLLFGKKELSEELLSQPVPPVVKETSTTKEAEGVTEKERPRLLEAEAKNVLEEVIGTLQLEVPVELADFDIRVWTVDVAPNIVYDEFAREFMVIGGVYAWYPPGLHLAEYELPIKLTYRAEDITQDVHPSDIKVAVWQKESKASIYPGSVDPDNNSVLVVLNMVPEGNMALVVPAATSEQAETFPVDIPLALDSDGDGLSDEEETIYTTAADNSDTDGDGYPDGTEVLNFYNPNGAGLLVASGLIQEYTNESYFYSLFYPRLWSVVASQGADAGRKVMFSAPSLEEFVEVRIEDNPLALSALNWYIDQSPGVKASQVKISDTGGLPAAWSLDGFTVYIAREKKIYLITYNIGVKDKASFKTTFEVMIKSFKLKEEDKIIYQNDAYGFKLELPSSFKGYKVELKEKSWGEVGTSTSLVFKLPTNQEGLCFENFCSIFTIHIFDYSIWSEVQRTGEQIPTLIDAGEEYVFTYDQGITITYDLRGRLSEIPGIISSFEFVSPY